MHGCSPIAMLHATTRCSMKSRHARCSMMAARRKGSPRSHCSPRGKVCRSPEASARSRGALPCSLLGAFMEKSRLPARREGVCGHCLRGRRPTARGKGGDRCSPTSAVRHLAMHSYGELSLIALGTRQLHHGRRWVLAGDEFSPVAVCIEEEPA
ncbi:hypothetical protein Dimus_006222, partial [Dionaea muscipula]